MALQGMVCVGWVGSPVAWVVRGAGSKRVGWRLRVCTRGVREEGVGRAWLGCKGFGSEHADVGLDACWVCGVLASSGRVCWLVAGWRVAGYPPLTHC